jgi:hypothetical protein
VQFFTAFASEHMTLAVTGLPAAVSCLDDRFDGRPVPSNC